MANPLKLTDFVLKCCWCDFTVETFNILTFLTEPVCPYLSDNGKHLELIYWFLAPKGEEVIFLKSSCTSITFGLLAENVTLEEVTSNTMTINHHYKILCFS